MIDYAKLTAFLDAWSTWGLDHYNATDPTTRRNLAAVRVFLGLPRLDISKSSETVDWNWHVMEDARMALAAPTPTEPAKDGGV